MSAISLVKKLRTFLLGMLFLLLFSWVFLVAVIALAPAEWLLLQAQQGLFGQQVAQSTQQVIWQNVQGNLSKGSAQRFDLPFISLEDVSWNISVWRLALANLVIYLQVGNEALDKNLLESNQPWHLQASLLPWGSLSARLKAGDLALLRSNGLPWALEGALTGELNLQAQLQGQTIHCQALTGSWQGNLKALQPMQLALGQINLQPSCPKVQNLAWLLTAEQAGEHKINLEGQVNPRGWSFSGQAKLEEQAKLRPALQMLGWRRNNQGEFQGRGSGRF